MIRIPFTEEEIKALDDEPYHPPHPRVQKKMEAFWLKSQGLSHGEIAPLTSIVSQYSTRFKQASAKIKELTGIKHS